MATETTSKISVSGTTDPFAKVAVHDNSIAAPEAIPTLFSSGVDHNGSPLPSGALDPHYQTALMSSGKTFTLSARPSDGWQPMPGGSNASETTSEWITPATLQGGDYDYRSKFSLNGFDPSSLQIHGQICAADSSVILINGENTSLSTVGDLNSPIPFTINQGFVAGENTLEIYVYNQLGTPTGLQVAIHGTGLPSPAALLAQSTIVTTTADHNGAFNLNLPSSAQSAPLSLISTDVEGNSSTLHNFMVNF